MGHGQHRRVPVEVACAVSHWLRLQLVGAYFLNLPYLPVAHTAALFNDVFHIQVSSGWVSSSGQKNSLSLADPVVLIKQAVTARTITRVDEAELRVGEGPSCVDCASTSTHRMFHTD